MCNDAYLASIVSQFDNDNVGDDAIVDLIYTLAHSGDVIKFSNKVFDFASTGGPSSLTTILVPLYLFGYGVSVINLAVPGRPAGAVDVLSQIEGYRLDFLDDNRRKSDPFYIHLVADEHFAPLDKALFDYRKRVGKVNVPNLAIASLMSKKVASGASSVGLDVRVATFGNFGQSWDICVNNARRFNRIANLLGIESTCFLSDANNPYQRYIGRGESLEALYEILVGTTDKQLERHNMYCEDIAWTMLRKSSVEMQSKQRTLKSCFEDNLMLQGSNFSRFLDAVERVKNQPHHLIYAQEDGYITYNLEKIRTHIVSQQSLEQTTSKYPDPCGVTLLCEAGDYVQSGTPVLSIRSAYTKDTVFAHEFYFLQNKSPCIDKRKEVI